MAWVVADADGYEFHLSEEAAAATRTFTWPTSLPAAFPKFTGPLRVYGVRVEFATDATGSATRRYTVQLLDSADDVLAEWMPATLVTLNVTGAIEFGELSGIAQTGGETSGSTMVRTHFGRCVLLTGQKLKILDTGTAGAGDSITAVHIRCRLGAA